MSEDETSQTEEQPDAPLDASYRVDSSSLGEEESDFAKALGFGHDGSEGASGEASAAAAGDTASASRSEAEDTEYSDEDEPESESLDTAQEEASADATPRAAAPVDEATPPQSEFVASDDDDESSAASVNADEPLAASERDAPTSQENEADDADEEDQDDHGDWEEIHPRSSAEGMQDTLDARADEVLAREEKGLPFKSTAQADLAPASDSRDGGLATAIQASLERAEAELEATQSQLAARENEIESLRRNVEDAVAANSSEIEKQLESLRVEAETIAIERDQLIDQLAATSGQLVQSRQSAEKLEASLRAARGALIPLPEGERALRAEVIGLRGRLDEAGQENVRLASEVASVATELAIATARVEDRQHEIDFHSDRVRELETEAAQNDVQLEEAISRHRDVLALATRLQAENTELRSTQAALEETLQARDLEITAREDHLRVTRDGLSIRDVQLIDLRELLEQQKHKSDALEADLERAAVDRDVLKDKVERRESRIATLTSTLADIEKAMGQRLSLPEKKQGLLSTSEWTSYDSTLATAVPPTENSSTVRPAAEVVSAQQALTATIHVANEEVPAEAEAMAPLIEAAPANAQADLEVEESPADEDTPVVENRVFTASPALPTILGRWRDRRFSELTEEHTGVSDFLATRLQGHLGQPGPDAIFIKSLGGSLPDAEVRLVGALHARGVEGIRMTVLDANDDNADARRHRVELAGLGDVIDVQVGDLADWNPDAPCHAILLADALHSQMETEQILEHLSPAVARGALILFTGRIGAGPVQLSASTLMRLEELWQFLPESMAQSAGLCRPPFRGDDGGIPVPAVDAGTALLARFEPIVLAGFGHLMDLVVGPDRGFMLSDDDDEALRLIESVGAIDESRASTESLPPRHGVAVFAHGTAGATEVFGQTWPGTR